MTPGEAIRQARLADGLTQAQLAALVGVQQRHVSDWERGRGVAWATLQRIAEALGRTVSVELAHVETSGKGAQ